MEFPMDFGESDRVYSSENGSEDKSGLPLVHKAASQGDVDLVLKLVKEDPSMLELQDADGFTPLATAVQHKQLPGVKRLVKIGANINTQDNLGRTCLAVAAYRGWYEGVVYLLRNGCKKMLCDKFGRIPLHAATYDTDRRALTVLLQNISLNEIDHADNEHMTALHWAAFHDRPTHLQDLIDKGADIYSLDKDAKTPLHWAAQNGSKKCCEILASCKGGADLINSPDNSGKSPVHFAAAAGHADILQLLAGYPDCDLEVEDPDERTPLHWAAATGQTDSVKTLLTLGVAPNQADAEGGTPLEYARQSGYTDCENILVKKLGRKYGRTDSKENSTDSNKESSGPLGFFRRLFLKKRSTHLEPTDVSPNNKPKSPLAEVKDNKTETFYLNASETTSSEQPLTSVSVLVPTICIEDPSGHTSKSNGHSRGRTKSLQKQRNVVISDTVDDVSGHLNKEEPDCDIFASEGVRKRSVSPKPLPPLNARSMSFPVDSDQEDAHSRPNRGRPSRRSKSLQPLSDPPTLRVPEDRVPSTSPPLSPRLLTRLDNMDNPVSPKDGSLAPIRGHRPRPGMLVNSRVSALQTERTGANRTPTPPPSEVDAKILQLNPALNPLKGEHHPFSSSHGRKSHRSYSNETEVELNSFPTVKRQMFHDEPRLSARSSISPLATGGITPTSLHRRPSGGSSFGSD